MNYLMTAVVIVYGFFIIVTDAWTLTGHCCGSPLLGADWDACLPVGDEMFPVKYLMQGHCDKKTWKRVP